MERGYDDDEPSQVIGAESPPFVEPPVVPKRRYATYTHTKGMNLGRTEVVEIIHSYREGPNSDALQLWWAIYIPSFGMHSELDVNCNLELDDHGFALGASSFGSSCGTMIGAVLEGPCHINCFCTGLGKRPKRSKTPCGDLLYFNGFGLPGGA